MTLAAFQTNDINTFKLSNGLLKNPAPFKLGASFEEVLEEKAEEIAKNAKEKASEVVEETDNVKKKKAKLNPNEELPNITPIIQNNNRSSQGVQNTYLVLEKFKQSKKSYEEELLLKSPRQQFFANANNAAGQPLIQPIFDQTPRRSFTKAQILEQWEKFAPLITEDITKKSIRLDIPLLHDVQALVLRMHPDRSVTASLLGSKEMGDLIKKNKDRLDKNLKHHHLSLKEFNVYRSELELNSESGTRKKKRQAKAVTAKKADLEGLLS